MDRSLKWRTIALLAMTGKSVIGKVLAGRLHLSFIDLDKSIEQNAGKSIPQIMEQQGESVFRNLETTALKEAVGRVFSTTDPQDKVIALAAARYCAKRIALLQKAKV